MTTAVGASQQLDEVGDRRGTGTEFANEIFAVVDVLNRESGSVSYTHLRAHET